MFKHLLKYFIRIRSCRRNTQPHRCNSFWHQSPEVLEDITQTVQRTSTSTDDEFAAPIHSKSNNVGYTPAVILVSI